MRSVSFSRTRPSLTRARACSWRALLRLALATLVVLSLATPALARAGVHPASNGATLSAEVDAKKPVARLNPRPGITVRAPATPRPVPLPPTRSCDVAAAGRGSLETPSAVLRELGTGREHPHQLRRIPRMNRGEPPRA
ncbi:MAG TPA: hypothetical protein VG937_29970 [Polyangiaceae bacterium]|jgi:hypothetical protein|nr:hypothetical protein [Polyangiaceae bacterium]